MDNFSSSVADDGNKKTRIPVSLIRENPLNFYENNDVYKKIIDKETGEDIELTSLAEGINKEGQMHNIVVYRDETPNDGKQFTLISGARRYKAVLYNVERGVGDGKLDALIIDKPDNIYQEQLLIIEGNKQRRREFQNKKTAYQEVLAIEQIFDNFKQQGLIPKGQVNRRKFVSYSLGISEGTIENLHHQFDKTNSELPEKKKQRSHKVSAKKTKYNEFAQEVEAEVSAFSSGVKLTPTEISFKYDSLEDLEHLLDEFGIDVDIKDFKKWLSENL